MSQGALIPDASPPVETVEPDPPQAAKARLSRGGLWLRVGLAVAILSASAVARTWQAGRVDQILREGRKPPFTLKELPMEIGSWKGYDDVVDEQIIRITGSTDSIFRSYQHQVTGQRVAVLVLFGPCTAMYGHTPEVCYPATGYSQLRDTRSRNVKSVDGGTSWPFRELTYTKGEGGQTEIQDVFYTWRYSGRWTPDPSTYREYERIPSMFKVQAARRVLHEKELDLLDVDNPCEDILALMMAQIDQRIAEAEAPASAPATAAVSLPKP